MSSHPHSLPEPTLPEHELIQAADALPELSPMLKASTLSICQSQVRRTQRLRRVRSAGLAAVVATVVILLTCLYPGAAPETPPSPVAEGPAPVTRPHSHYGNGGTVLGLDSTDGTNEIRHIDHKIEQLERRLHDSRVVPSQVLP